MLRKFSVLILVFCLFQGLFSCRKDKLLTDTTARLKFSADTLLFDTVFTTIGSTTRHFLVRNPYNQPISISNIHLAGGTNSPYKVNVDGSPLLTSLQNIQIRAKDSMYVWVKVTINPTSGSSPMIVADSILFDVNGHNQHVILEAVGQNVYLHKPNNYILLSDGTSVPYSYAPCGTWPVDKPHLIFNYLVVDSACTAIIPAGAKIFMHNNAVLWVYKGGTLQVTGSYTQPVTFAGDRLEADYAGIPGQWGNIWLSALSKNNTIDWAIIKNASVGLLVDTVDAGSHNPTLRLTNTRIFNMSVAGIYARGSTIVADNVAISNCAQYSVALTIGGCYSFRQCSFADYYSTATRSTPSVVINNWYTDVNNNKWVRNLDSAHFYNCIIDGANTDELKLDSAQSATTHFRYLFDHCLMASTLSVFGNTHFNLNNIYNNTNTPDFPNFYDPGNNNLNIHPNSPAAGAGGNLANPIPTDLNNVSRDPFAPAMGAYEPH